MQTATKTPDRTRRTIIHMDINNKERAGGGGGVLNTFAREND